MSFKVGTDWVKVFQPKPVVKPEVKPTVQPQTNNADAKRADINFLGARNRTILERRAITPTPSEALEQISRLPRPSRNNPAEILAYNNERAAIAGDALRYAEPPKREDFSGLNPATANYEYSQAKSYYDSAISQLTEASNAAGSTEPPPINASEADGEATARQVSGALDDINDKTIGDRLFGEDDADRTIDDAVRVMEEHKDDPDFQRAFLETLGPDKTAQFEARLKDKGGRDGVVRNSLAVAGDNLSTEFQQQLVGELGLEELERYTGDSDSPMPDAFLVAAGKKAINEGFLPSEMVGASTGFPVLSDFVEPHTNAILQNIADSSPTAANELLQDEAFVTQMLRANDGTKDGSLPSVSAIIRAGTDPTLVTNDGDRAAALHSLSQVLSAPDSIQTINVASDSGDKIVGEAVALALADAYKNNVQVFAGASQQGSSNSNSFDNEDARGFMTAALQHDSTLDRMSAATQVAAAILLQRGSDFRNTDPNALNISGDQVGTLLGTFTSAYATAQNLNLQPSEQDLIINSLLDSAILSLPSLVTAPEIALGANFVANLITSLEGADETNAVQAALDRNERATSANFKITVFQQYYDRVQFALDNPNARGITSDDLARAREFQTFVQNYNDGLPAGQKILDGSGDLIDISTLHPNNNPGDARIIENMNKLVIGQAGSDNQVVFDQLDGVIDDIQINFGEQIG